MTIRSESIRKRCYCKDESGRRLGARCSRLKLASGAWSSGHGVWAFQIELPPAPGGRRRILRRVSNTQPGARADVAAELARVCELMSLADGDEALADEIAEVLMACKLGRPAARSASVDPPAAKWRAERLIDQRRGVSDVVGRAPQY
ncbi:hypothetical protein I0C86_38355 [Plantactinospora sp. S1510]|uniref:Integrase n=1 Tax=Plantactinospora alkalitolerans TaxID=2789879 RepID=A0ABS0H8G5_9ACTN|nr:hypothetical protein [Plantactinospora alkalitolerans]MBF9134752.1 hypothetical protein [Plantactinospora alkalitolerans]